ncbi:MAG: PQQ-binding-like beta-propeller repeat protein [Planctomycetota bacterium]|nr:PQQ-binding-like beta-propeller repeat protein [Planctomycetota bacterium]
MRTNIARILLLVAFIDFCCFLPSTRAQVLIRNRREAASVPASRLPADRKMEAWLKRASEAFAREDWAISIAFCQKILEAGRTAYIPEEEAPKALTTSTLEKTPEHHQRVAVNVDPFKPAKGLEEKIEEPDSKAPDLNPGLAPPNKNPENEKPIQEVKVQVVKEALDTTEAPKPEDPTAMISLEEAARRLLFRMPEEARELYRAQYSKIAEQTLERGRTSNDVFALSRVWSMYPLTPSAWDAADLLGTYLLEQGNLLLAVTEFEKLILHPEFSVRATPETLLKFGTAQIALGRDVAGTMRLYASKFAGRLGKAGGDERSAADFLEQTLKLPALSIAVARDWPAFLGSGERNVIATTTPPFLDPIWSFGLGEMAGFPHEHWNSLLVARRRSAERVMPAVYPVAKSGRVYFKGLSGIVALDARTGRRLWESESYPGAFSGYLNEVLKFKSEEQVQSISGVVSWVQTAVFMDVIEFTIAVGEKCLVSLGRVFPKLQTSQGRLLGSSLVPDEFKQNQIVAFDIQTGRAKWRISGDDNSPRSETAFKNTFFLGAPTIQQGKVFVMGDSAGEVSLFILKESDGSLIRRIPLCLSQPAANEVEERRQDACPVTIHQGIALCPTQVGRLFAVAAHSGEILWTASYPRPTGQMPVSVYSARSLPRRQVVSAPMVSGERVVFLPADGDRVLCLDLQTGNVLWIHLVDHEHFLAAVASDRVLVIGWDEKSYALLVNCIGVTDGLPLKSRSEVNTKGHGPWLKPSGRGLLAGNQYLLPIAGKRLANIDLRTAETTIVLKSAIEFPPAVLPEARIPLPTQWRFTILDFKEDWTSPEFDDSDWRVAPPTVPLSDLGFTNFRGTVRYRVPFAAIPADSSSRLVLSFSSLPQDSKIFINGQLVSNSKTTAEQTDFDIFGTFQSDKENLLALEVRTSSLHQLSVPFLHWEDRLNARRELGNLIAHRGLILSAGPEGLDAYPQMKDVSNSLEERLATDSPMADDLLLMAKLHLNLGKDREAEASIRKAQTLDARATLKEELRRALFQALLNQARQQPGSLVFQEALSLALTQREKYEVLLHLIDFHQAEGKGVQAVQIARELALSNPTHFISLEDGRNIRADIWLQNKIGEIGSKSPDRQQIVEMFEEDLIRAGKETSSLNQILRIYRELPDCGKVYLLLAEQLLEAGEWQQAELLLLSQAESNVSSIAPQARRHLIRLYHELGLKEALAYEIGVFKNLNGNESLGADIQSFLPETSPEKDNSMPRPVVHGKIIFNSSYLQATSYHLSLPGLTNPFARQTSIHMTSNSTQFVGNGWQWSLVIPYTGRVAASSPWRQRPFYGYSSQTGLTAVGHMIIGPFSQSLKAVSPLMRQVVWEHEDDWRAQVRSTAQPSRFNVHADSNGSVSIQRLDSQYYQDYCFLVGASAQAVLLFDSGDLVALEPATGAVMWHQPVQSAKLQVLSLAGDYLLAKLDDKDVQIYRLRDGQLIGRRAPTSQEDGFSYQGSLITIHKETGTPELRCTSLIDRRVIWSKTLQKNTTFFRVNVAELGIIQDNGSLEIVSIDSGVKLFESRFPVQDGLPFGQSFGWMTPSRLFLLLPKERYQGIDAASQLKLLNRVSSQRDRLTAYGTLHCFEDGGEQLWKREFNKHELFRSYSSGPPIFLATKRDQRQEKEGNITRSVEDVDLEVIDIHTGKTIAKEAFKNPGYIYQVQVMDEKNIVMRSNRGTIQIEVEEE